MLKFWLELHWIGRNCFGRVAISTVLILSIKNHVKFLFLISSSISSFIYLVKFILGVWDAIANAIISLISWYIFILYRKGMLIGHWALILYTTTLLSVSIICEVFLASFVIYKIISSINKNALIFLTHAYMCVLHLSHLHILFIYFYSPT